MVTEICCNGIVVLEYVAKEIDLLDFIHQHLGLGKYSPLGCEVGDLDVKTGQLILIVPDVSILEKYYADWNVGLMVKKYENSTEDEQGNLILHNLVLSDDEYLELQIFNMIEKMLMVIDMLKEKGETRFVLKQSIRRVQMRRYNDD